MKISHLVFSGLLVLTSAASFIAQETKPTPSPPTDTTAEDAKYDGWIKIDEKTFSFYAPKDTKGGAKRGIDTAVYRYEGGGWMINFDIGALANPAPRFSSKEVTIDGQTGLIAHGAHQSHLYVKLGKYTNFNMYVSSGRPDLDRDLIEKMFMSVKFKSK